MNDPLVATGTPAVPAELRTLIDAPSLDLSDDEFTLLGCLIADRGHVVDRTALRDALPGIDRDVDPRIVDCYAVRLMVKLARGTSLRVVRAADRDGYALIRGSIAESSTIPTPYP